MAEHVVELHPGQLAIWESPALYKVVAAGRRFGKSHVAAHLLLANAMMTENQFGYDLGPSIEVYYIAPTLTQAREIMWPKLLELGQGLIESKHEHTSSLTLKSGRTIRLKGADDPDRLRGVGLSFVVLDEYADMKESVWKEILMPTLADVNGGALFIGCVTADTLILGENGLEEIGTCPIGYSNEDKQVYGLGGFHKAENRYGNPKLPTKRIKTKAGLELEATPNHRIWTPAGWKRMDELRPGDPVYMQYDQQVYGKKSTEEDWAYFLGLYLAEGNAEPDIYRITITSGDDEIHEWLERFGFRRYDKFHSRLNSKEFFGRLREWFPDAGTVRAPQKSLSPQILQLDKQSLQAVLRGYFDGDGTVNRSKQQVACTTSSPKLAKQLQALLLNMGYRAVRSTAVTPPTERVKVSSIGHRLALEGRSAYKFAREIGFALTRKQELTADWTEGNGHQYWFDRADFGQLTGTDGYLARVSKVTRKTLDRIDPAGVYDRQLLADEVSEVTDSEAETFDFCIPDTHSYFSNGLVSHNTPKGKNHFYQTFMQALHYEHDVERDGPVPLWEAFHFRTTDNPFLTKQALVNITSNMGSQLQRQELDANFVSGEGRVLKPDWFEVVDGIPHREGECQIAVTVDLAGFVKAGSRSQRKMERLDDSVIAVTFLAPDGCWYVKEIQYGKWDPRETALRIVRTISKYPGCKLGIERGHLEHAIREPLEEYMREFRRYVNPQQLDHGGQKKQDRIIWSLQARAERGRLKLVKGDWNEKFLEQVGDFPDPLAHDDLIDAVAYADQLLTAIYVDHDEYEDEFTPIDLIAGW